MRLRSLPLQIIQNLIHSEHSKLSKLKVRITKQVKIKFCTKNYEFMYIKYINVCTLCNFFFSFLFNVSNNKLQLVDK